MKAYFTIEEAADKVRRSRKSFSNNYLKYCRERSIEVVKDGNRILINSKDLQAALDRSRIV